MTVSFRSIAGTHQQSKKLAGALHSYAENCIRCHGGRSLQEGVPHCPSPTNHHQCPSRQNTKADHDQRYSQRSLPKCGITFPIENCSCRSVNNGPARQDRGRLLQGRSRLGYVPNCLIGNPFPPLHDGDSGTPKNHKPRPPMNQLNVVFAGMCGVSGQLT